MNTFLLKHPWIVQPRSFAAYAAGSSLLIAALLGMLIFGHSGSAPESINDIQQRTAEYEKQGQTQLAAIERQRVAATQEAAQQASESRRRIAMTRIEGLEGQLSGANQTLASVQSEKAAFATRMKDYMMDHKLAIAALGITAAGAAVAIDPKHQFTDDQKKIGGVSAVVAGLYALSNHKECIDVADRVAKATTMQSDFDHRIEAAQKQISSLEMQIGNEKSHLQ